MSANDCYRIVVIGAGYVGLSNAVLLAQPALRTQVTLYDIDADKVAKLQAQQSPIQDDYISDYLQHGALNLYATNNINGLYSQADLVIIATPTNHDVTLGKFDSYSVESSIAQIREQRADLPIVIKSTVAIGYTGEMQARFGGIIMFMPEFLREGKALYDNLYPSRLIVGTVLHDAVNQDITLMTAQHLLNLYQRACQQADVPCEVMGAAEAESVKLFANSYLATRIAFFNELDSFAEKHQLDSQAIIRGVCLDSRIGMYYNNPSFGYGGYCLPKDTQQLKANYQGIPANLIHAVVDANSTRKRFIARQILAKNPQNVGIYRLSMKKDADNFRDSAILDIIELLQQHAIAIQIYEPSLTQSEVYGCKLVSHLAEFLQSSDLIMANRWYDELNVAKHKVYSRDIFGDS